MTTPSDLSASLGPNRVLRQPRFPPRRPRAKSALRRCRQDLRPSANAPTIGKTPIFRAGTSGQSALAALARPAGYPQYNCDPAGRDIGPRPGRSARSGDRPHGESGRAVASPPPTDCTLYDCKSFRPPPSVADDFSRPPATPHTRQESMPSQTAEELRLSAAHLTSTRKTGSAGEPISPSGNGGPCAKTIRPMATAGTICRTITPAAGPIAGARTACWATPTASAGSVLPWPCGTSAIRSSRSGCSA